MSRHTLEATAPTGPLSITRLIGGWDRALQSFFLQGWAHDVQDEPVWQAQSPDLGALVNALKPVGVHVPDGLIAKLVTDCEQNVGNVFSCESRIDLALPESLEVTFQAVEVKKVLEASWRHVTGFPAMVLVADEGLYLANNLPDGGDKSLEERAYATGYDPRKGTIEALAPVLQAPSSNYWVLSPAPYCPWQQAAEAGNTIRVLITAEGMEVCK